MSFDLMVFNPDVAPKDHTEFIGWYEKVTEWEDDATYDNPTSAHPKLYQWYKDMQVAFPDMNGPDADDDIDNMSDNASDYGIAVNIIYVGFSWSVAEEAFDKAIALAAKNRVGFFDPQSETVFFPSGDSNLLPLEPQQETKKPWWKLW